MQPIANLTIAKVRPGRLSVSFDYTHVASAFDHSLVLVVEQDHIGDDFELRPRPYTVNTSSGPVESHHLDFFNKTYGQFWNVGGSAGNRDDTGNRRWLNQLPTPLGGSTLTYTLAYNPLQPDTAGTSTIPGLEFYAVVAIVAAVNGRAAVQLGEIAYSNQLAGA